MVMIVPLQHHYRKLEMTGMIFCNDELEKQIIIKKTVEVGQ